MNAYRIDGKGSAEVAIHKAEDPATPVLHRPYYWSWYRTVFDEQRVSASSKTDRPATAH
jgi:hypothetical protein